MYTNLKYIEINECCETCTKTTEIQNGILCKILFTKPWEIAKKSQSFVHYYLLIETIHVTFSNNHCCYIYLFCPTTTNLYLENKYRMKVSKEFWYENKDVIIKTDEIYLIQDYDLKIHYSFTYSNELHKLINEPLQSKPQLILSWTANIWNLRNINIINNVKEKIHSNFSSNNLMFYILNRNELQKSSKYFYNETKYEYVYNTIPFIYEYIKDMTFDENINCLIETINKIRNNNFKNNKLLLTQYRNNHLNFDKDKKLKNKINAYNSYFKINS